jgi:molybdenum cofactor synthesis domain-containing protein
MDDRVVSAAVIIIGNEILSGRTQDTNLRDISLALGRRGIRIAEARVVADVEISIVAAVNELRMRYDYVLTTGGIGPTHDDITTEAVAKAFGVELVEHPTIAAFIRSRPASPEIMAARMRMALVPRGAGLIENDSGSTPGFYVGNVYVLAGIPHVMRLMLATVETMLTGGAVVQSRSVRAFTGESAIARQLGKLQQQYPSVDIGSYPFVVDGRIGTTLVARGTHIDVLVEVVDKIEAMLLALGVQPTRE